MEVGRSEGCLPVPTWTVTALIRPRIKRSTKAVSILDTHVRVEQSRCMSGRNDRSGRIHISLLVIGILLVGWLYAMGFPFIGMVKGLTFSKTKLQMPNPTSYVFHATPMQMRSALPHWGLDEPCPPAPTPCLILNRPTDGTTYDLVQLDRIKSDVYRWLGKPLEYEARYTMAVTPVSDSQTRVDIRTFDSNVLIATNVGIHGGDYVYAVAPTSIEEYRFLLTIGNKMGEKGMPPLRVR